jgi:hypothetical protein
MTVPVTIFISMQFSSSEYALREFSLISEECHLLGCSVRADVSEERISSIIRVIRNEECRLVGCHAVWLARNCFSSQHASVTS